MAENNPRGDVQVRLRTTTERLQAILDTIDHGILFLDRDLRALFCNRAFYRIWGIPEVVVTPGTTFREMMDYNRRRGLYRSSDEEWEAYVNARIRAIRGGDIAPTELAGPDGIVLRYQCTALPNGERMLTYLDVTALKTAQREAEEKEARLRTILDTAPEAIVIIDGRGIVQSFSASAETLFGYAASEVIGRNVGMLMPPPHRDQHDRYIARYLRTGKAHMIGRTRENVAQRKDGSTFPIEIAVGEVNLDGMRLFTGFLRDISARRRKENRLRRLQADLERVARLSLMGEMVATMTHEMNQPLAAITNYVEAARDLLASGDSGRVQAARAAMDKALEQAHRTAKVILHLREFMGKGSIERTRQDINALVKEATAMSLIGLANGEVELHLELADGLPAVSVDGVQIQQVVANLVRNAVDAMAGAAECRLTVTTALDKSDRLRVSIADTGPGIDSAIADRLFDPFVTTKPQGIGIGLAICCSIVNRHRGRLWATGNEDGGATFHFTIPVDSGESEYV